MSSDSRSSWNTDSIFRTTSHSFHVSSILSWICHHVTRIHSLCLRYVLRMRIFRILLRNFQYIFLHACAVMELIKSSQRSLVSNLYLLTFSVTAAALPWFAYFLHDWEMLAVLTSVPFLVVPFVA